LGGSPSRCLALHTASGAVGGASLNLGAKVAGGRGLRSVPPGSGLDASPAAPFDLDGVAFSAGSAMGRSLGKWSELDRGVVTERELAIYMYIYIYTEK